MDFKLLSGVVTCNVRNTVLNWMQNQQILANFYDTKKEMCIHSQGVPVSSFVLLGANVHEQHAYIYACGVMSVTIL